MAAILSRPQCVNSLPASHIFGGCSDVAHTMKTRVLCMLEEDVLPGPWRFYKTISLKKNIEY